MKRSAAREIAIQLGFAVISAGLDPETAVSAFFEPEHFESLKSESELYAEKPSKKDIAYISESVAGVVAHREEFDRLIGQYAKGWRTERISRSAAAVLRQAMYEILYMPDVPDASAIDDAVELMKGYEDAEVVAFVNGVLGGFYRGEILHEGQEENTDCAEPASTGEQTADE